MDLEWEILRGLFMSYPLAVAGFFLVLAVFGFGWLKDRKLDREAAARNDAAVRCHHGVNKYTRNCRKCAREFAEGAEPIGKLQPPGMEQVRQAIVRAMVLAAKHKTNDVHVTVRFQDADDRWFFRTIHIDGDVK